MKPAWVKAAEFAGIQPDQLQISLMDLYADWLRNEAVRGGGVGPEEDQRLDVRHLADSVLFASQLEDGPGTVWDLGTGVGLPGIPLAICLPQTRFLLIDRSGRRVDLTRRAIRILGLENCEVAQGEIDDLSGHPDGLVSRATLPPDRLRVVADRILAPGGTVVAGGSWVKPPRHDGWTTIEIPRDVLDQPVWLLIMRPE